MRLSNNLKLRFTLFGPMQSNAIVNLALRCFIVVITGILTVSTPSAWAANKTVYVSDEFTVPLRSGASNRHRIRLNLKTGTSLTLLKKDEKSGYTQVRTLRGTEGWVQNQYLVNRPIARIRLLETNAVLEKTKQQLSAVKSTSNDSNAKLSETQQQLNSVSRQNQSLTSELTSIKKISANAINLDENNRELLKRNELLKIQIAELQADNSRLADKSDQEWFIRGVFAVAIGAILTVLLPRLKPRTRSREWG